MSLISLVQVSKNFHRDAETVHALRGASLDIAKGQVVALMGPSGSGKSTLLNIMCGWETADEGQIAYQDHRPASMKALPWIEIGIVPQRLGLLEDLSASENIELPFVLLGSDPDAARDRVADVMERLDIAHLADRLPAETSLGEQQRICIGRAVVMKPALILADEPTGNQDHKRGRYILGEMRSLAEEGTAVVIATHDAETLGFCDRVIHLHDGELVSDERLEPSSVWGRSNEDTGA